MNRPAYIEVKMARTILGVEDTEGEMVGLLTILVDLSGTEVWHLTVVFAGFVRGHFQTTLHFLISVIMTRDAWHILHSALGAYALVLQCNICHTSLVPVL